jgi:hypothetical protein
MNQKAKDFIMPVLIGLVFVAPFFILEWFTTSGFARSGFPGTLFVFMWVNSSVFVGVLFSALKNVREGTVKSTFVPFIFKVLILVIALCAWVSIVLDQMPCFLGASGC